MTNYAQVGDEIDEKEAIEAGEAGDQFPQKMQSDLRQNGDIAERRKRLRLVQNHNNNNSNPENKAMFGIPKEKVCRINEIMFIHKMYVYICILHILMCITYICIYFWIKLIHLLPLPVYPM